VGELKKKELYPVEGKKGGMTLLMGAVGVKKKRNVSAPGKGGPVYTHES